MLASIPQLEADALAEADWYKHRCIPGMGRHIIGFNYDRNQDCSSVMPLQILYHRGRLSGFVWQHMAKIPQDPTGADIWEYPGVIGALLVIDRTPTCIFERAKNPGLSTMHYYFLDQPWLAYC